MLTSAASLVTGCENWDTNRKAGSVHVTLLEFDWIGILICACNWADADGDVDSGTFGFVHDMISRSFFQHPAAMLFWRNDCFVFRFVITSVSCSGVFSRQVSCTFTQRSLLQ